MLFGRVTVGMIKGPTPSVPLILNEKIIYLRK